MYLWNGSISLFDNGMQDCSISSNAQCKMAHLNNIGYTSGTTYIYIYSTTIQ